MRAKLPLMIFVASLAGCTPPPAVDPCDHSELNAELETTRGSLADAIKRLAHANSQARALQMENERLTTELARVKGERLRQASERIIPRAPQVRPPSLFLVEMRQRGCLIVHNQGGPLRTGVIAVHYTWSPSGHALKTEFFKTERVVVSNWAADQYYEVVFNPPPGAISDIRVELERNN